MRKVYIFGFLILPILFCLFSKEKEPPIATITEIEGIVEVKRAQSWESLTPLQPLFAGDIIRISKLGKAVLMYFGRAPETISENDSPYTVKNISLGKSKKEKASQKLDNLFKGLFGQEADKKVNLVVRGATDGVRIIQPDKTAILFPGKAVVLTWQGQYPPFTVSVFKGEIEDKGECVFELITNDTSLEVPTEKLVENASYSWKVSTTDEQWNGRFTLKNKTETESILKEIDEILKVIPQKYPITQAIVTSLFLIDRELFYDAYQVIGKSLASFPKSEALKLLYKKFSIE